MPANRFPRPASRAAGVATRRRVLVLLLAGVTALAGCTSEPEVQYADEEVRPADVVERVSAPGSVQPTAQADLTAPAAARIQALAADGQQVRAGQVVARLTSEEVDQAVAQAEQAAASASALDGAAPQLPAGQSIAALDAVQLLVRDTTNTLLQTLRTAAAGVPEPHRSRLLAHLEQAQKKLADARGQARRAAEEAVSAVSQQTAGLQQAMTAATAAQRAQAQAALEVAHEQRERLTLRAPIGGTVQLGRAGGQGGGMPNLDGLAAGGGQLPEGAGEALEGLTGGGGGGGQPAGGPLLRVGSEVTAGQTVLSVLDVSRLTVAAEVDETDVALVREGLLAEVELDAYPGEVYKASVERVALTPTQGQASALGGVSYRVDLYLAPPVDPEGPMPRSGMTATASIRVREARAALSVAASALVGRGEGQAVYVIGEDGRVHLRPVELAASGDERVAVASGVRAGERVVTRGAERLSDNQEYPDR